MTNPPSDTPRALRPYQEQGKSWLTARHAALLASDPGLGKTAMFIRACLAVGARRVLVLCPAVARVAWEIEPAKWGWTGNVWTPARPGVIRPLPGICVISYTQAARADWRQQLLKSGAWDVIGLDEAHRLKERNASATQTIYGPACDGNGGLVSQADHVWLLSGTPAPNNYAEVWTHLHALSPHSLLNANRKPMGFDEFRNHVCETVDPGRGRELRVTSNKNASWLRERLADFMLRQRKRDVVADMPPLDWVDVPIDVDPDAVLEAAREASFGTLPRPDASQDDDQLLADMAADPHIGTLRRVLGVAKAPAAAEWIADQLDSGMPKVIVFALHREVLDILHVKLGAYGVTRIDGGTPPALRKAHVARFQDPRGPRVFLGQIVAAGTAITLTAASDVVMVEMSWTPSDNYQAACRAHRLGQSRGVLVRVLSAPGTFDARVANVLRRKSAEIAALIDA